MNRLTPYLFPNGSLAPNRLVVPPMASGTADAQGATTSATLAHYRRLARSGAGLVFVEYSFIHPSGRSEERQLGADDDAKIPGLTRIAEAIHSEGALAGLQLVHAGGKTSTALTGQPLIAPSPIPVPVKDRELETPEEFELARVPELATWWKNAAGRASRAGFDVIELHAAHGYGLNQWISPLTNQRRDRYAGAALLFEILSEIRSMTDRLLAVRLPAHDHFPGGLGLDETSAIARELERRGLDLLDVSSGVGGWRRPEGRNGEGYLVADAHALKSRVSIPVIGVGGIETGVYIDRALSQNQLDFAAVGRALLKDPEKWRKDQMLGNLPPTFC